jgi:hypothetical protein
VENFKKLLTITAIAIHVIVAICLPRLQQKSPENDRKANLFSQIGLFD